MLDSVTCVPFPEPFSSTNNSFFPYFHTDFKVSSQIYNLTFY